MTTNNADLSETVLNPCDSDHSDEHEKPKHMTESEKKEAKKQEILNELIEKQNQRRKILGAGAPKKTLWKLAWPSCLAFFFQSVYVLIDGIFIGQKDPLQSAAVSYSSVISVYMKQAISMCIAMGTNGMIAVKLGQKDFDGVESIIANSLYLCIIQGCMYPIIMLPSLNRLLPLLGVPPGLMEWSKTYCYIVIGTTFFNVTAFTWTNILRAQGYAKLSGAALAAGVIVNIVIDPSIIFGANEGIIGSSVSIAVGNLVTSLVCFPLLIPGKLEAPLRFRFKFLKKPSIKLMKDTIVMGSGSFFNMFANGTSMAIMNHLITKFSVDALETEAVVATLGSANLLIFVFFSMANGMSSAYIPTASFAHAANLTNRFFSLTKYTLIWTCAIMVFAASVLVAFALWWPYVFYASNTPVHNHYRKTMTHIIFMMMPSRAIVGLPIMTFSVFQSVRMPLMSAFLGSIRQIVILIPFSYLFAYVCKKPIRIIISYPLSDIVSTLMCACFLFAYRERLHLKKSCNEGPLVLSETVATEEIVLQENAEVEKLDVEAKPSDSV